MSPARRTCLLILDGGGYSTRLEGNAVRPDTMPRLFDAMASSGFAVLGAASEAVGLEPGQVGNSEAGHLTIGAGTVVPCMSRRIQASFEDGSWAADPGWEHARRGERLHVVGLVSDAGVHGFARTLHQAAATALAAGVREVVVHAVLDGVDSLAGSAPALLVEVRRALDELPAARLGVVVGRKHFCDRSGDLDVSRVVVDALCGRAPLPAFTDEALAAHLERSGGELDFPAHLAAGGATAAEGEPFLVTSHRADRARQVARVLTETHPVLMLVDPGQGIAVEHVFFPQGPLERGLAHELQRAGLGSVRIAEKCKFPHVTHFLNGYDAGLEGSGVCIPSIPEGDIAGQPEMSLAAVVDEIVGCLGDPAQRVVIANLANLDQVGHLGRLPLAEAAAREVDTAFARIRDAAEQHGWSLLVTADHGNADLVEHDGAPFGSHTESPVPLLVLPAPGATFEWHAREGSLANVAATCLSALDLEPPDWMEPALGRFA